MSEELGGREPQVSESALFGAFKPQGEDPRDELERSAERELAAFVGRCLEFEPVGGEPAYSFEVGGYRVSALRFGSRRGAHTRVVDAPGLVLIREYADGRGGRDVAIRLYDAAGGLGSGPHLALQTEPQR